MSFNADRFQAVDLDFFLRPLKAFINERKHQKSPHKAVKQKKTHQAVVQSHSTEKAHDYHPIQESSSQSSSFDVTGPETPSPHLETDTSALRSEDNQLEANVSQVGNGSSCCPFAWFLSFICSSF